jgi:antitoxin (DNA-binding transcriptional repressor) of toxin-antitoxin stability system
MDKILSMKDIRLTLAAIARRAEAGESFTVVRDSKPVFRIEPLGGGGYEMPPTGSGQRSGGVRDSGEAAWASAGVEMEIPEKVRKRLRFPEGARIVFFKDADGHAAVQLAEIPVEFTPEEWGEFLRKTEAEPVTRFRNRKEALRHLGKLMRK